jgi:uncharacterized protein (TIGR03437 family)
MRRFFGYGLACALAMATGARADLSGAGNAPNYSAASIVNAATQLPGPLAPNAIATVYGTNLSWDEYAITAADISNGYLPNNAHQVTVYAGGLATSLFYVSPTQINFLIPYELTAGPVKIFVARDGVKGPDVVVQLNQASPGFFEWNGNLAVAEHADLSVCASDPDAQKAGCLVSSEFPAAPGEVIVLYAAGLGHTAPNTQSGRLVKQAAWIASPSNLQISLNGNPIPQDNILYAGLAPGFAGLYQINLRLPDAFSPNPVIQIVVGSDSSPSTVQLPTR